jgi:hypothetical protein
LDRRKRPETAVAIVRAAEEQRGRRKSGSACRAGRGHKIKLEEEVPQ